MLGQERRQRDICETLMSGPGFGFRHVPGPGAIVMHNTKRKIYKYHEAWAVENGYKPQAASVKAEDLHAVNTESFKHQAPKATSRKRQAPSSKPQASSRKRPGP